MKTFKRLVVSIVSLSLTVSLTGCGIIREMMSILNGSYPEEVSTSEPTSYEKVETMIGKDGGVVKDEEENVTISIPQGALQEDTNISAQYIEEPSYLEANPSMNFLGAVEFGPSGTTFDKPVEVSLQLTDTPKHNKISIFCYSEEYDQWDFVTEANVNYNVATFSISHFSKYKALDMSKGMLMKFHDLVKQAQATGQPDSWVLESFKKYLIEEEHVMDIYALYGGYWYEPCGLIIGGNYHINGKEGDPDQLTDLIGETNKIGNTYGLCHDGQLVVDAKTYHEIKGKPKEGQEIIAVGVAVYYKMIKPDIDLTTSKKNLHKGESTTINIRCHYTNVANYFDEFKDLDMDGYMLTISKPSHFDIDKTSVLTDGGRASFVVTAKENNKAETITVNFDVTGDFGTHAEGNITLNTAGVSISGHICEEYSMTYVQPFPDVFPYPVEIRQTGFVKITIDYNFEGQINENDYGQLAGSLNISNANITLETEDLIMFVDMQNGSTSLYEDDMFKVKNIPISNDVSLELLANQENDGSVSLLGTEFKDIIVQSGNVDNKATITYPNGSKKEAAHEEFPYEITISTGSVVLLPFTTTAGEYTSSASSMVDTVSISFFIDGMEDPIESYQGMSFSTPVEKTTQTITVTSGIQ